MTLEILGGLAILVAAASGIGVWLIKRSERAATQAAEDRADALEAAVARRNEADEVQAQPVPTGDALLNGLQNRRDTNR